MHQRGFLSTIRSYDGSTYNLPEAMYWIPHSAEANVVIAAAKEAAAATGLPFEVLVVPTERGIVWEGLSLSRAA
jgi:hypothetical protein